MKRFQSLLFFLLSICTLQAHPSWGLVVDSKGLIYFVDVLHNNGTLWCYDSDLCYLKPLIQGNFHAHSLQIDEADNLYIGTQLWIEGEIMGDGQNCFMKYNIATQQLDTLVYSEDYDLFFGGNVLWNPDKAEVYYPHQNRLRVHNLASKATHPLIEHQFERFSSMLLGENEVVWISDSYANDGSIYSWHPVRGLRQEAKQLFTKEPGKPVYSERSHWLIYGMHFSHRGNLIYCESAYRGLHEILPDGSSKLLYQSPEHYFPTGVYVKDERMYIMEVGYKNKAGHLGPRLLILQGDEVIRFELAYG